MTISAACLISQRKCNLDLDLGSHH